MHRMEPQETVDAFCIFNCFKQTRGCDLVEVLVAAASLHHLHRAHIGRSRSRLAFTGPEGPRHCIDWNYKSLLGAVSILNRFKWTCGCDLVEVLAAAVAAPTSASAHILAHAPAPCLYWSGRPRHCTDWNRKSP